MKVLPEYLPRGSALTLYVVIFFTCASFAIVLPSQWPYTKSLGGSIHILPLVVAVYSVGEFFGSPAFGALIKHVSAGRVVFASLVVGIAGSVAYALAPSVAVLITARFVQGLWSGGEQSSERVYVTANTRQGRGQQLAMANLSAAATLGFLLGPAIGAGLSLVPSFCLLSPSASSTLSLCVNKYTTVGWYTALTGLTSAVLAIIFLRPLPPLEDSGLPEVSERSSLINDTESSKGTSAEGLPLARPAALPTLSIVTCVFVFFVGTMGYAVLPETILTPLIEDVYGLTLTQNYLVFVGSGLLGLVAFASIHYLSLYLSPYALMMASVAGSALSFVLMINYTAVPDNNLPQFLVGFGLFSYFFPLGRAVMFGLFADVVHAHNVGLWMGVLVASAAFARMIGPFIATFLYSYSSLTMGLRYLFGGVVVLHLLALALGHFAAKPLRAATAKH